VSADVTACAAGTLTLANDDVELVLAHAPDAPVRVLRLGAPGAGHDLPGSQAAVEVVTVDAGRTPAADRLSGGTVSARLRYTGHRLERAGTRQVLVVEQAEEGGTLRVSLRLELWDGVAAVRARATTAVAGPAGGTARQLLAVAPLALTVGAGGTADPDALEVSLADNQWIGESRWRTLPLRAAGLPDLRLAAHGGGARGTLSRTSRGLWSTGDSQPVGVLTVADQHTRRAAWAWQVESTAGWRWEIGEHLDGAYLALSGPTDLDHGWSLRLEPGDEHVSPAVTVAVGADLEAAVAGLTAVRRAVRRTHPDTTGLRVVFNDYMNTLMGDPTTEKVTPLVDAAADAGAEVFCIDCGWYDDTDGWWWSVGEWQPSTTRFPGGLQALLDHIRDKGMVAGLWLEPEVVGVTSPVAARLPDDAFLQRGGQRLVEHGRYHLDLRHPAARAHLDETVDRLVAMGVGFFKLDYNINPVAGTDVGADSPAQGLVGHAAGHRAWLAGVLDRHPDLIVENCSSGAMRADPELLRLATLQSTSDQQDPVAYPPIAASAPLAMLPEQAGSWAYPQPEMDDELIAFTMCTGMLGRLYLSGRVDAMTTAQQSLVAEGVAAHKRLRAEVATGTARWPLGVEQWDAPWVAAAVDVPDATHLTVWRRPGAQDTVEVPLPQHTGHDLVVTTTYPTRLAAWPARWDAARGVLTVAATGDAPAARTLRLTRGRPVQRARVDLAERTGAVHGGATGMLYGLVEPGVPGPALLAGVRPRTVAQKSPGGLQHPGGDALELLDGFVAAGGQDVYVYVQDALTRWPYEEVGIDAYLDVLRDAVRATAGHPERDRLVWVPFNEPDWIWYADWSPAGRDRFLADWDAAVAVIRAEHPGGRVAGPNEADYHPQRVRDVLAHAQRHGTLPDVVSWHELQPHTMETYRAHLAHLRSVERELGLPHAPVNIDEYGNRRDMSVPAQLLLWAEAFESTKVDADLAYWTLAGNLDDQAVGAARPNGGWWLLHWYASLRGETVVTTVPHPDVRDSLRVLAAVDDDGVATALVGGTADDVLLTVTGLTPGAQYRQRVAVAPWSGYQGVLEAPPVVEDGLVTAGPDGVAVLRLAGGERTSVHRVDLLPVGAAAGADAGTPVRADAPGPWQRTWPVDPSRVVDGELVRHGDDPQHYHGTGPVGVLALAPGSGSVAFDVTVPADGEYAVGVGYGTAGVPAGAVLRVDGDEGRALDLPATLEPRYTGRVDVPVTLTAGPHTVEVTGATVPLAVDHLRLRASAPGTTRYDAALARRTSGCRADGATAVAVPEGGGLTFFVVAERAGTYALRVRGAAAGGGTRPPGGVELVVAGRHVPEGSAVALPAGVAQVDVVAAAGPAVVAALELEALPDVVARTAAAGDLVLRGTAHVVDGPRRAVGGLTAQGAAELDVSELGSGAYLVTLEASNAHRLSGHEYNTDAVVQDLLVGQAGTEVRVPVHHTVHDASPHEVAAVVELAAGGGPLRVAGADGRPGPGARLTALTLRPWSTPADPSAPGTGAAASGAGTMGG
jgi:alpha-galactosidase